MAAKFSSLWCSGFSRPGLVNAAENAFMNVSRKNDLLIIIKPVTFIKHTYRHGVPAALQARAAAAAAATQRQCPVGAEGAAAVVELGLQQCCAAAALACLAAQAVPVVAGVGVAVVSCTPACATQERT